MQPTAVLPSPPEPDRPTPASRLAAIIARLEQMDAAALPPAYLALLERWADAHVLWQWSDGGWVPIAHGTARECERGRGARDARRHPITSGGMRPPYEVEPTVGTRAKAPPPKWD